MFYSAMGSRLAKNAKRLLHRGVFENGDVHTGVFVLYGSCTAVPWRDRHSVANLRVHGVLGG